MKNLNSNSDVLTVTLYTDYCRAKHVVGAVWGRKEHSEEERKAANTAAKSAIDSAMVSGTWYASGASRKYASLKSLGRLGNSDAKASVKTFRLAAANDKQANPYGNSAVPFESKKGKPTLVAPAVVPAVIAVPAVAVVPAVVPTVVPAVAVASGVPASGEKAPAGTPSHLLNANGTWKMTLRVNREAAGLGPSRGASKVVSNVANLSPSVVTTEEVPACNFADMSLEELKTMLRRRQEEENGERARIIAELKAMG